jgi:nucleoside-diphosphate-sugar epimerase
MRYLVTGSSGYIGSRLVEELASRGHMVVGVDRVRPVSQTADEFVHLDLVAGEIPSAVFRQVDGVFHLAAAKDDWGLTPDDYYRDNLEATRRLIEAGRQAGVGDWIFFSTVGVMGPSEYARDETSSPRPQHSYGASKLEAERLFEKLAEQEPAARILILRPSAVYGPGHPPTTNVYRLIEAIRRDRFVMVGNGSNRKTLSYLDNLMEATLFLIHRLAAGAEAYICVDEPVPSTIELVRHIHARMGKQPPRWRVPLSVAKSTARFFDIVGWITGRDLPITSPRVQKFCTSTVFDAEKVRALGFQQPITNEEALTATVQWHLERDSS